MGRALLLLPLLASCSSALPPRAPSALPVTPAVVLPEEPQELARFRSLSERWRALRDPAQMEAALPELRLAPRGFRSDPSLAADLDEDGELDWVGIVACLRELECDHEAEVLTLVVVPGRMPPRVLVEGQWPYEAPHLYAISDVTGDDMPELVLGTERCGASTCEIEVEIRSGAQLDPLAIDGEIGETSAGVMVRDATGDGVPDVVIGGGTVGSAGGGPWQRSRERVWSWRDGAMVLASETYEASSLRIHVLHDAVLALRRGDANAALALLERIVDDASLLDDPPGEQPQPGIVGPHVRRAAALLHVLVSRASRASRSDMDRMRRWLLRDDVGGPYAAAMQRFFAAARTDSFAGAVDAAAVELDARIEEDFEFPLSAAMLGYNAPVVFDGSHLRELLSPAAP